MGGGEYFFFFFQVKTRVRISAVSVVGGSETELGARGKWARSESTRNMYANLTRVMQLVAGNKVGDSKQARGQGKRCRISRCLAGWKVNIIMEGFEP